MSGRGSGSLPYSVTESKAVDRRLAGMPSDSSLKRRVGAEGVALAGEHARGVFVLALESKGAGRYTG
jgi:hypothetical protein